MRRILLLVAAGAMLLALGIPVRADPGGTVTGTVMMETATPCLEILGGALDFGSKQFSRAGSPIQATGAPGLTNCASVPETILAHGSDATGTGATWTLVAPSAQPENPCNEASADRYYQFARVMGLPGSRVFLTANDQSLNAVQLPGGSTNGVETGIFTACLGSSGSGTAMSMQWVFTATVP